MDIKIHGQNIKVTEQLTDFTQKKMGKLDRYLPNIAEIRVDITQDNIKRGGYQTTAQITLRHTRGAILRAEERIVGDDGDVVKMAVQKATDKMYRQIERFKGKRKNSRRGSDKYERFVATEEELEASEEVPDYESLAAEYVIEDEDVLDNGAGEILRRKAVELMPMNEEEAIAQMELLGHSFFMFMNGDTGKINTIYRRDGGGYGLLVPEL